MHATLLPHFWDLAESMGFLSHLQLEQFMGSEEGKTSPQDPMNILSETLIVAQFN